LRSARSSKIAAVGRLSTDRSILNNSGYNRAAFKISLWRSFHPDNSDRSDLARKTRLYSLSHQATRRRRFTAHFGERRCEKCTQRRRQLPDHDQLRISSRRYHALPTKCYGTRDRNQPSSFRELRFFHPLRCASEGNAMIGIGAHRVGKRTEIRFGILTATKREAESCRERDPI
jgi:hypothetical protein